MLRPCLPRVIRRDTDVLLDASLPLSFLVVELDEGGNDVWSILTRGEIRCAPPVTYADTPTGAETLRPALH